MTSIQRWQLSIARQEVALLRAESTQRLHALLDEIGEITVVTKTTTSVTLAVRVDRSA